MTDTTISAEDLVSTYESLIKKGILRATGPVEYDRGGCLKCGNVDDHGTQWKSWKYCPKCGGSIKATMSTTNDEQAKYGEHPKEREPMLSNVYQLEHHGNAGDPSWRDGARSAMIFYEDLITTGKLRVVDEVECRELDLVEEWYSRPTKCLSCGVEFIMALPSGNYAPPNYCPGCGNKIKR